MRKLFLFLLLIIGLPRMAEARYVFADLSKSNVVKYNAESSAEMTTNNGVSYKYKVPANSNDNGKYHGFLLWDVSSDVLKYNADITENITVVAESRYPDNDTDNPFFISICAYKTDESGEKTLDSPVEFKRPSKNSDGRFVWTINLKDLNKDLSSYQGLQLNLMRMSDGAAREITIRQVYLHQNTNTETWAYDPVNGGYYVPLTTDAWAAWGCVSISNDNGNMLVKVAPKTDTSGNVLYKDASGSPQVLGGLVLDIGQRDFTKVLRVQMNQKDGDVANVYKTNTSDPNTAIGTISGRLLNYLDVAKADGTDINNNGKFWYSQYDFRYVHYQQESENVSYMEWTADWPYGNSEQTTHLPKDFTSQTMTISQFLITYDVFRSEPWHEASLRNAPLYSVDGNNNVTIDNEHFNYTTGLKVTGSSTSNRLIYGSNVGLFGSRYADVSKYNQIKIYATKDLKFEAVFDFGLPTKQTFQSSYVGAVSNSYKSTYQGKDGTNEYGVYTIDIPSGVSRLNILSLIDGTGTIDNVTLYSASSPIDYFVSGQMYATNDNEHKTVKAALSNRLAMNIDATDLRNTETNKIDLTSANKNCLVYVTDKSQVSNTDNVIVRSGTYPSYEYKADNIVLTDAVNSYMNDKSKEISRYHYPFFAPYDITAAQVTYTGYTGKYGTVCLPFSYDPNNNVSVASGSKAPSFYTTQGTMNYDSKVGHYVVNATLVKSGNLAANQPALIVNPDNTSVSYTVSANDVTVTHTAASDLNITDPADNSKTDDTKEESELYQGNLQGVYSMRHPQEGGYVLQQQGDETVMFHKVVNNKPTLTQFRSYLVLPSTSKAKAQNVIGINFIDDNSATAIESATTDKDDTKVVARYNAVGERVTAPVRGLNIVEMADGSVKKVMVK
jgi:hypothetical protein